jgi:hypothetical protein
MLRSNFLTLPALAKKRFLRSAPRPHPLLTLYVAIASKCAGICDILGSLFAAEPDEIDTAIAVLRRQLSEVYGKASETSTADGGGVLSGWVWKPDGFLLVALYKGEKEGMRFLTLDFAFKSGSHCVEPDADNPFQ